MHEWGEIRVISIYITRNSSISAMATTATTCSSSSFDSVNLILWIYTSHRNASPVPATHRMEMRWVWHRLLFYYYLLSHFAWIVSAVCSHHVMLTCLHRLEILQFPAKWTYMKLFPLASYRICRLPMAMHLDVMCLLISLIHNAKDWIGSIKWHQLHFTQR